MIIDAHVHIRSDQLDMVPGYIRSMDKNNIDKAIVMPIIPSPEGFGYADNEFVRDLVAKYPTRLLGFATVFPNQDDAPIKLERYINDYRLCGLKLHPSIQDFFPNDPKIFPVVKKCIELDIPILFHTGPLFVRTARLLPSDVVYIDELALAFPEAKIIIGHGDPLGWGPSIVGKHPNVYMDTSINFSRLARAIPGLAENTIELIQLMAYRVEGLSGADKIIFGSDSNPLSQSRESGVLRFEYNLEVINAMKINETERKKILGGNITRLLKLGG